MKNAIITGATGFIGSNLSAYLLKHGWNVSIIVRENSDYSNIRSILDDLDIFVYNGELQQLIDFFKNKENSVVFHLASCFIAEHNVDDVNKLISSNVLFGTQILEAMRVNNLKKMINTGTSWQHYNNKKFSPVCLYASTKEAFENIIEYYVEAESFSVISLHLFDTYGENDSRGKLINQLVKFSRDDKCLDMSPGEQPLDLVHIDDVIDAYNKSVLFLDDCECDSYHKIFAVSSGHEITLKELLVLFNTLSKDKIRVVWGGREYRRREVMELWKKYQTVPGWSPKISIKEGLMRIIEEGVHTDG